MIMLMIRQVHRHHDDVRRHHRAARRREPGEWRSQLTSLLLTLALVQVAINLIVQHVQTQLVSRGFKLRSKLAEGAGNGNGQYIMPGTQL